MPDPRANDRISGAIQPSRIGRYQVERKLGEGGMGVVYAVRDSRLERTIALKTLPALTDDETARERLWREARAAASVNHPHICQIYEIGEDDGRLFIAMELLEGEPLSERLRTGALNAAQATPIALEMLAALSALHAPRHRPSRLEAVQRLPDVARCEAARLRPGAAGAGRIAERRPSG